MDKSPKLIWGSPAFKDNNSLGLNQRNNTSTSVTPTQGSNNNENTRLLWCSPLSPAADKYFGSPISSSSPNNSSYYGHEKQMPKYYRGRNYAPGSGGPAGEATQYPRRYSSPISSFGGRSRPLFHESPVSKQNQYGNNNNSYRYSATKTPPRSFHGDNTPYCSPNSPNLSSNQSFTAEDYFKPSMLEDPWEKLRKREKRQLEIST